ncbi:MAG: hypothetical protein FWG88_07595 [Oscillospiraceae bacterium]|nr:hypothetical protein [Oscillospiraceae bacterium]
MNKIRINAIVVLVLVTIVTGCSIPNKTDQELIYTIPQKTEEFVTFQEAVDLSSCAIVAELLSYEINRNGYLEYTFAVKEVLRGLVSDDTIYLIEQDFANIPYELKEHYILIMTKYDSLFHEVPQFSLISRLFIPINDIEKSSMYGEPLEKDTHFNDVDELITFIRNTETPAFDLYQKYSTSTEIATIVKDADFVLHIDVIGLYVEGTIANSNTYYCKVTNQLKGDGLVTIDNSNVILITLLKECVNVNESYVVMVNLVGKNSVIYSQSSKLSVISINDHEAIDEVESLLSIH